VEAHRAPAEALIQHPEIDGAAGALPGSPAPVKRSQRHEKVVWWGGAGGFVDFE
jgi:hypothetical protein